MARVSKSKTKKTDTVKDTKKSTKVKEVATNNDLTVEVIKEKPKTSKKETKKLEVKKPKVKKFKAQNLSDFLF